MSGAEPTRNLGGSQVSRFQATCVLPDTSSPALRRQIRIAARAPHCRPITAQKHGSSAQTAVAAAVDSPEGKFGMEGGASRSNTSGLARLRIRTALLKSARDALIAGFAFTLMSGAVTSGHSNASPQIPSAAIFANTAPLAIPALATDEPAPIVQIATTSSVGAPDAIYKRTSVTAAWALLALAFSGLAALNVALVRHLRRAYARPVRRGRREQALEKTIGR